MNTTTPVNTETAHGIKTANLVKDQTELEGQMALNLIQSADINMQVAAPTGHKGHIVNIKV
ncbi:cytoplasmic protein [Thalassotalea profundi]|nr:cytoplasmic protein [Thalassotalea profundi]